MNRKQFIESQGATCRNWTWSWSFINHEERFVIFGVWNVHEEAGRGLIFSEDWAMGRNGKRSPSWPQSREHIRLVEEEGYRLTTFKMIKAPDDPEDPGAPWKIADFTPQLQNRQLQRIGGDWFSVSDVDANWLPEEVGSEEALIEGATSTVLVNRYERNAAARAKCIAHYGIECLICGFDFESKYGELGKGYIHVHHIVPLAQTRGEYEVDPIRDLLPVCANCHAMIHSARPDRTIDQIRASLQGTKKGAEKPLEWTGHR
jgi:5-methylcytosine-specific restriction protein A